MKAKNIFITGKPGTGKTTLIRKLIDEFTLDAGGFFTQEVREAGERVGFDILTLDGRRGMLARKGMKSNLRVGRYGVSLKDLEEIAVDSIKKALWKNKIVIIDEIGKMELFSEKFKEAVLRALDSEKIVLGTIKLAPDPFTDMIRQRSDTIIFELTPENREEVKGLIKNVIGV
ncbi:MAG: NTPase [Actinobacteria bacterium]|nr:NTPase [Actinomycetota bacterium]